MHGHVRDTHLRLLRFANVSSMKNDERLWRGFLILYKRKNSSRWNLQNFVRDFATHTKVTAVFVGITLRRMRNDGTFVEIWYFTRNIYLFSLALLDSFPSLEVLLVLTSLVIINTDIRIIRGLRILSSRARARCAIFNKNSGKNLI